MGQQTPIVGRCRPHLDRTSPEILWPICAAGALATAARDLNIPPRPPSKGQIQDEVAMPKFDLNIEEMLSHWEPEHALREFIANALDEQVLTQSRDIEIETQVRAGRVVGCRIRDFGRGLRAEHFTMNENLEKLDRPGVIGKFGVGLKDALATLHRRGAKIRIRSPHGVFTLVDSPKHGFDEITTLHVECAKTDDSSMVGTEVVVDGITADQVKRAKTMFLRFSGDVVLESTRHGEVLEASAGGARVYVNGVLAAAEPRFLFSYNITSLTPAMRKHLSRERVNIGRTVYADRVKAILVSAKTQPVTDALAAQVPLRESGDQCEEMTAWAEVREAANRAFQSRHQPVFLTQQQLEAERFLVDEARAAGKEVVVVPDSDLRRAGNDLTGLDDWRREYSDSFRFKFVDRKALSAAERRVFALAPTVCSWVGMAGRRIEVRISENMRRDSPDTQGVWLSDENSIVLHRGVLRSPAQFAGTFLHELAHAATDAPDVSREFESQLSDYLGTLGARLVATAQRGAIPSRDRRQPSPRRRRQRHR